MELDVFGDFAVFSRPRGAIRQNPTRENGRWKICFDEWDEDFVLLNLASPPFTQALRQTTPRSSRASTKPPKRPKTPYMRRFEAAQSYGAKSAGD